MRKRQTVEEQHSLFDLSAPRATAAAEKPRGKAAAKPKETGRTWRMPEVQGSTVAEIRVRWPKRLTPAQAARAESELSTLPKALTKLGFGTVAVEHVFVRRRKK
jgi:hypothetical protein